MSRSTPFRQPKGAKIPKKQPSEHDLMVRAWKASKRTRPTPKSLDGHRRPEVPRATAERLAIAEELFHASQLRDLDACMTDGFGFVPERRGFTHTTPTEKERTMSIMNWNGTKADPEDTRVGIPGSTITVRTGGSRARKPWRDDCRIQPSVTLAPDPQAKARSAEDARLLAKRPIDPTTRKAEPVLPDGVWSLDDLIDDRRMVRMGC
jgi:hypothetical protein